MCIPYEIRTGRCRDRATSEGTTTVERYYSWLGVGVLSVAIMMGVLYVRRVVQISNSTKKQKAGEEANLRRSRCVAYRASLIIFSKAVLFSVYPTFHSLAAEKFVTTFRSFSRKK